MRYLPLKYRIIVCTYLDIYQDKGKYTTIVLEARGNFVSLNRFWPHNSYLVICKDKIAFIHSFV